jgi:1-phosphofructokinase family hexose kinase
VRPAGAEAVIASVNTAVERLLVVAENRPGAVHRLARSETLAGGKGVNVARVLRQLGGCADLPPPAGTRPVTAHLIGFLGGPTGVLCAELLAAEGLSGTWIRTSGATRVNEVLVDRAHPDRATVYNAAGATVALAELAELEAAARARIATAAAVVCTGSLPPGVPAGHYATWVAAAGAAGAVSLLDTSGPALLAGAAVGPDVVKVNREELAAVSGPGGPGWDVVASWQRAGTRTVIVTDGSRPALAVTPDGVFVLTPARIDLKSAVGSGDAFTAGLVWSLLARPAVGWRAHLQLAGACGASNAASELARLEPGARLDSLAASGDVTEVTLARVRTWLEAGHDSPAP